MTNQSEYSIIDAITDEILTNYDTSSNKHGEWQLRSGDGYFSEGHVFNSWNEAQEVKLQLELAFKNVMQSIENTKANRFLQAIDFEIYRVNVKVISRTEIWQIFP